MGSSFVPLLIYKKKCYKEMCDLYKWYSNGNEKDEKLPWDILG